MRGVVRLTLALTGVIVCRNARSRAAIAALGVPADKIVVLSGFYGRGPTETATVPPPVEEFLNAHSPVIGAVASIGPEYGLPLIAEAATRLRSAYPRLGLLLMGPAGFARADLDGSLLVAGQLPHDTALAVMRRVKVFVRPTYFDGDASSVREALALGIPVVASDTDFRPEGVMLFRRGDVDDLAAALARALQHPAGTVRDGDPDRGAFDRLLGIYDRVAVAGPVNEA